LRVPSYPRTVASHMQSAKVHVNPKIKRNLMATMQLVEGSYISKDMSLLTTMQPVWICRTSKDKGYT